MSNLELYRGAGELETFRAETPKTGTINGVPYVDRRGKLFEAGVHRGKVYTEADLDRVVQQFSQPKKSSGSMKTMRTSSAACWQRPLRRASGSRVVRHAPLLQPGERR